MKQFDEIRIENLQVHANHGVFPEETALGQRFIVSAILYSDLRKAGQNDDLAMSTNYGEVCQYITECLKNNTFRLIEAAAEFTAKKILLHFPLIQGLELEIKKPWAPIGLPLDNVSVRIKRSWHESYIALGSNMGDKKGYLDFAIKSLDEDDDFIVEKVSDFIVTKPYGGVEQDDFLNGALKLKTLLSPKELLERIHIIEKEAGRTREIHWGPRTLDLDILMYDDLIYEDDDLVIPHVEMHKRDFVLKPLAQIAPNLRHPIHRKTITELLNEQ